VQVEPSEFRYREGAVEPDGSTAMIASYFDEDPGGSPDGTVYVFEH
jgi:hypothetical protein